MNTLTLVEWEVLNAASDDVENLEQIYHQTQNAPRGVRLSEAADAVRSLVEKGLLAARTEDGEALSTPGDASFVWKAWFEMTPRGREVLSSTETESCRSVHGLWKDLGVAAITVEEIAEARREMWKNFPREFPG